MKKIIFSFLAIFVFGYNIQGQVVNGSFEQGPCPNSFEDLPDNWEIVSLTPDLISRCASYYNVGVDCNYFGCQEPKDGDNYISLCLGSVEKPELREMIRGRLSTPLKKDSLYIVSFWYSKSDNYTYGVNNIGIYFDFYALQELFEVDYLSIDYDKVIFNQKVNCDSLNWSLFIQPYIAKGGEEYICIGNFLPDSYATFQECYIIEDTAKEFRTKAYYYIDDVKIEPALSLGIGINNPYQPHIIGIYDLLGEKHDNFINGMNIVIYSNGKRQKIFKELR